MRDGTQPRRPRGRPRQYDPEIALGRALATFWRKGFAATSLDDLSRATEMNRPSLYAAFGDKKSIYRRALAAFAEGMRQSVDATLFAPGDLRSALTRFYDAALDTYLAEEPALGCFAMCTTPVEAVIDENLRQDLADIIAEIDAALAKRFRGEATALSAAASARQAQAVLHSVALRARAGASRSALRSMCRDGVELLCTPPRATV